MDFFVKFSPEKSTHKIEPHHKIMLIGSCFTEHMGTRFEKWGWDIFQNPTGVIYNPISVKKTLERIIFNNSVQNSEMYEHEGVYHHWDFHSRFSHVDKQFALNTMNESIQKAHEFIKKADWLFITWGSAHVYTLKETGYLVSNCHRVPNKLFTKSLSTIIEMKEAIQSVFLELKKINPSIKICQTVSPVRHIKDGIVENSRSKARLIELSYLLEKEDISYFPAYEILIDVLRDYRFFDADLVHPNYAATQYVWENFTNSFFSETSLLYLSEMIELIDAYQHKPRFADTTQHSKFLEKYFRKCGEMEQKYSHLDLKKIKEYFANQKNNV